jgi:hypothetical protein
LWFDEQSSFFTHHSPLMNKSKINFELEKEEEASCWGRKLD